MNNLDEISEDIFKENYWNIVYISSKIPNEISEWISERISGVISEGILAEFSENFPRSFNPHTYLFLGIWGWKKTREKYIGNFLILGTKETNQSINQYWEGEVSNAKKWIFPPKGGTKSCNVLLELLQIFFQEFLKEYQ